MDSDDQYEHDAPLVDMSHVDIRGLDVEDHPALKRSIDRLIVSLNDPDGVISAFSSFVE